VHLKIGSIKPDPHTLQSWRGCACRTHEREENRFSHTLRRAETHFSHPRTRPLASDTLGGHHFLHPRRAPSGSPARLGRIAVPQQGNGCNGCNGCFLRPGHGGVSAWWDSTSPPQQTPREGRRLSLYRLRLRPPLPALLPPHCRGCGLQGVECSVQGEWRIV
jgi:hypothetical protein